MDDRISLVFLESEGLQHELVYILAQRVLVFPPDVVDFVRGLKTRVKHELDVD